MLLTSSADLDPDFVLQVDQRLDLELEADVEVVHRLRDEAAGRRRGGGDHRHAVADVDARLLLVLDADARVGEHVGAAVLLAQLEQEQRVGERELHQLRAAVLPFGQGEGARHARGADQADRERVREADAELEQPARADLQHLDFQHHLRLGQVVRGDQPLGQAHRVRRVLDHQQVQLLVDEQVARLHQRAHHVGGLLHVGVGEVEALHHQLLVLALLLRRVRIDQQRVLVHHLLVELVGGEHQADQLLGLGVAQHDGGAQVGAHVAVEHEVHPGAAREGVEHRAQRHVAQLEGDRLRRRSSGAA